MIYTVRAPFFPIFMSVLFTPAKTVSIFVCNSKNDLETSLTSTDWVGSRDTKWNCTAWGRGQLPYNHRCSNLSFWEILAITCQVYLIELSSPHPPTGTWISLCLAWHDYFMIIFEDSSTAQGFATTTTTNTLKGFFFGGGWRKEGHYVSYRVTGNYAFHPR